MSLGINGTNIFASSLSNGIFLSTNNGSTWTPVNTGLTTLGSRYVNSIAFSGTNIFAATEDCVYLSTNNGGSWTSSNAGITSTYIHTLAISGTQIFAGTQPDGMFLSVNNGTSWTAVNAGIVPVETIISSAIIGTYVFIGTAGGEVYYIPLSEVTGVEETAREIPLTLAPNPFNSTTTLTFNEEQKNTNVKIMDVLGKEIKSINFSGKQLIIEKGEMQEGVYFVQVSDENKNVSFKKIVVQ